MELHRCYGCMQLVEEEVCPHCGWQISRRNEAHQLQPGMLLRGQYEIGRVLGQGGFGITYLGFDRNLETVVCIKEYFPSHAVSRDCTVSPEVHCHTEQSAQGYHASKERFLREAKVLAQFRDIPEIVGIYNFFEENNTAYIVMEYIRGTDLAHYIQRRGGVLSPEETFRILKPIMQAMASVHRAELVHRDIAPDNIMLHPRGGAKLLDFGAARMVENAGVEKGLNRSTEAIVKHGFAPMEQYQTRGNLGPWTDVYAMCATVYYCLTGQIPPEATSRMMGDAELDWNRVPGLTDRQRYALEKGMAIHARDRYASMEELMDGLFSENSKMTKTQPLRPERRPQPSPAPRKKKGKKGLVIGLVAAAVVLLLAAGGLLLATLGAPQPAPEMYAPPAEAPAAEAPAAQAPAAPENPGRLPAGDYSFALFCPGASGYYSEVISEALVEAFGGGDVSWSLDVYSDYFGTEELAFLEAAVAEGTDAIIWIPSDPEDTQALERMAAVADSAGVPVIITGRDPSFKDGSCAAIEQSFLLTYAGADIRTIARRLVQALEFSDLSRVDGDSNGTISYAILSGSVGEQDEKTGQTGIADALSEMGWDGECLSVFSGDDSVSGGHRQTMTALNQYGDDLEVIFCLNEELAQGAIGALEAWGAAIGKDIFVVAVGDTGLREMVNQGLYAGGVKASMELQADAVTEALADGIQNHEMDDYYRLSCELVVTGTSAAAPGEAPSDEWENSSDGIRIETYTGDTFKAYVMLIHDPSQVYLATSTQGNFSENIPGARITEIMEAEDGIAAINAGAFFDDGTALPSVGATPLGLVIAGGEVRWNSGSAPEPELEAFVGFDSQNRLVVAEDMTAEKARELGIRDGCVYGPILIQNGKARDLPESGLNPRTAIGQHADGTVFLVSIVGRRAESMGGSYDDLIEILSLYGAENACCLAGSSASTMAYRDTYGQYGDAGEIVILNEHTSGSRRLPTYWMVGSSSSAGASGYIARGTVMANGLNYRAEPTTDARSLGQYSQGTVLNFLTIENGWGLTDDGWVVMHYVKLEEEDAGGDDVIRGMVTVGELNVRTTPSMDSDSHGFIVYGTQVEILEIQEVGGREWGLIDQGWIKGWILMAYVEIGGSR